MIHAGSHVPLPYSLVLCTLCTLYSVLPVLCTLYSLYSVLCTLLSYPCCTLPQLLFGHVMQDSLNAVDLAFLLVNTEQDFLLDEDVDTEMWEALKRDKCYVLPCMNKDKRQRKLIKLQG